MICECNTEIDESGPKNKLLYAHTHGVPFFCKHCGAIKFKYRAINDFVFLWPIPLSDKFVEDGLIERPLSSIDASDELYGRSDFGVILSVGPGYCDDKKFYPTHTLKRGMKVIYDRSVPWRIYIRDNESKPRVVIYCGFKDVRVVVEEDCKS